VLGEVDVFTGEVEVTTCAAVERFSDTTANSAMAIANINDLLGIMPPTLRV